MSERVLWGRGDEWMHVADGAGVMVRVLGAVLYHEFSCCFGGGAGWGGGLERYAKCAIPHGV